ncbi:class I SAM-dependent methyltransferase [Gloeocapsopsis dulcis]|uniref:SAM-dependent methyltransferase n=1 Tax=Gloeocapsopsis dulcis AAB1 = 1H9 TaxID=1433147 RepID=A0A6N8FTM9_9CHRO|nr:class I SAM-dependent methyltransferase [Gloeocapsopsis dulcis]MUL36301.1 SAM-dependent methyltransferase [Gloeocapsopsis dulcis AAB1 = 1H9]WNN89589.1 class I SAM-dependent methyltransferase [Gloeocapsopsis dulcis]
MSEFDFTALFSEDYLYFYEPHLTPERNEREVNLIWNLLQLQAGMTVLDLACGHGRIANLLAQRGCSVTGLDATPLFLEKARQEAQVGINVEYIQGDMRSLPWTEHFDCIINWFTAFGYFDDEDNRQVLAEAYRALKPGGKLLIELLNLYRILKEFRADAVTERDSNYQIDRIRFDVCTNRTYAERTVIRDGQVRRMNYFVRHFTFTELQEWLLQMGFQEVQGYGNDGELLTLDSRRMIVLAIK